jgi:hypothetical protein
MIAEATPEPTDGSQYGKYQSDPFGKTLVLRERNEQSRSQ